MKKNEVIFSVVAALLPAGVYEYVRQKLSISDFDFGVLLVSGVISFLGLLLVHFLCQFFFDDLNKYHGQWVEEMERTKDGKTERRIAIGEIKYDRKTREHVFSGKTYSIDGKEECTWSIDYLRQYKDDSMQYICGVDMPQEMSIGKINFLTRWACNGNIWVMDGTTYRYQAYCITKKLLQSMNPDIETSRYYWWHLFCRRRRLPQESYKAFVREYAKAHSLD